MIGPRCLIGVGDSRDSFPADFARGENGFVGTGLRHHSASSAGEPYEGADRPAHDSPQTEGAPAGLLRVVGRAPPAPMSSAAASMTFRSWRDQFQSGAARPRTRRRFQLYQAKKA
jgi:hypothetical protein